MIASLPMYARPSNRAAHDAFWALIRDGLRARGVAAPDALDHGIGHLESWAHPALVLGQICNLPYRAAFRDRVTLIGAADYGLPGCAPGYYNSVFVAAPDHPGLQPQDFATARFACNDLQSQSGYGAAQQWAAARGFLFTPSLITGSHRESIASVARGAADIATIDAQTWRMACQDSAVAGQVRVVGHTDQSAALTYITGPRVDHAPHFAAIADAIAALPQPARNQLGLRGIVALPQSAYDFPLPPKPEAFPEVTLG